MGLLDRFAKRFLGKQEAEVKSEPVRHVSHHSNLGTKAERRTKRKIAHESRRVNFQKAR